MILKTMTIIVAYQPLLFLFQVFFVLPVNVVVVCASVAWTRLVMGLNCVIWLSRFVGPVLGLLSVVHLSLECSTVEFLTIGVHSCQPGTSCLVMVVARVNCTSLW
jgi:hypothetical protein